MINPFKEINWKPGPDDLRKFAWSLIIGFPCVALVFYLGKWMTGRAMPEPRFFLALAGLGAAAGLVCLWMPFIARPLYHVWYALAACIGLVVSNLLFALIFYGLFAPMGLFMRLIGRDPLNLQWRRGAATYWIKAPPPPPPAQYFNQY